MKRKLTERWSDDVVEMGKRRLRKTIKGLNDNGHVLLRGAIKEKREVLWSLVALCRACMAF